LPRKLKFFINYLIGPLLFIGISFSIYRQLVHHDNLSGNWENIRLSLQTAGASQLVIITILMLVNWSIESIKWQVLLNHLVRIRFLQAFRSVISGLAFTMITPNRMGEFIGRVFYVPDGSRIRAVALTIISSASQLIITLFAGSIGLFVLHRFFTDHQNGLQGLSILWLNALLAGSIFAMLVILFFYFRISWLTKIIDKIPQFSRYAYFIEPLEKLGTRELLNILSLSAVRYIVFVLQYWLIFKLFDVQLLPWQAISAVTVLFLVLAVVPTIALAELGIRTKASLALFSMFSSNGLGILMATAAIWLINIILPAVAGSLFVFGVKLFGKEP
jgi:MFS family permease